MSELGQHLKTVREEKGITLEDLQATTKIQKRYLVAIEEGRFETLPGLFYARAFVKTYAESVGIDPEELFDQYKNELPNPQKEVTNLPSRRERSSKSSVKPSRPGKKSPLIPLVAGLLTIVVIAALVWLVMQSLDRTSSEPIPPEDNLGESEFAEDFLDDKEDAADNETEDNNEGDSEGTEEEEAVEESQSVLTLTETQGTRAYYELTGTDELMVELHFSGSSSYYDIKDDSRTILHSGQPNTSNEDVELEFDLSEENEIEINIGASNNVEVYINGELIEYELDAVHQYIHISFSSDE
ncbi:hypothetical protein AJ85_02995 [Alkalihalobacillus alcalophilus ATCC 27647 = CGMCC 1.3604]|uniref:HTH cro/C1-type domain-containing protein n=1 Tax=Alkalihalobacillus alcalophilus ATCC 27647 = CGMCC 1.3604 TaxID=1218173 RepID=A0A094WR47_ALKAL|nr:helix-turn-helix domain-containing protein [Alkalihalobacillus alcalophilus]KGA98533.1 hypothetical protein BALCAV_0204045 [Alkalihalobacillus alcalophilus ATCC 27647 = CGMCC 1.3604]MED1562684.1 helix-turn-helix domain-containing protein [Alkalihalobacillus alcalophilus]THG91687.1 hypothetical protein AJ85_02995 [Alkalihalobacillus alcalophilus ATCC 27647 = CGMCC 1.3604]